MSTASRRRRRATQRRRAREQQRGPGPGGPRGAERTRASRGEQSGPHADTDERAGDRERAESSLRRAIGALAGDRFAVRSRADVWAHVVSAWTAELAPHSVVAAGRSVVDGLLAEAAARGWTRDDATDAVRRVLGEDAVGVLATTEAPGGPQCPDDLRRLLQVGALLERLPRDPRSSAGAPRRAAGSPEQAKRLATVRALLAKAERTAYDAEADALAAKAQELISKHSLERLVAETGDASADSSGLETLRLWLDAPYVDAKVRLVGQVAAANRARCVVAQPLGLCIVIGRADDLEGIELLVTSLLVQADRAMLRQGRRHDGRGSRTRAFRSSFLLSFAARIGERLREAAAAAVVELSAGPLSSAGGGPDNPIERSRSVAVALRGHERRLDEEVTARFPRLGTLRSLSVTDGEGWVAGRAAADLASLDVRDRIGGAG